MLSPKEREKRDTRGDKREGQGRKRNRNESEETEEILRISIFIRLSVECRESNHDILMSQSSQRSLHRKLLETNIKRFYIAVLSIAQF